jgi:hypothetical protein
MIDLPAQVAMMSSEPALLSARRRGEKHSMLNEPEPSKKSANPAKQAKVGGGRTPAYGGAK